MIGGVLASYMTATLAGILPCTTSSAVNLDGELDLLLVGHRNCNYFHGLLADGDGMLPLTLVVGGKTA